ncbi:hypothetical protein CLCR_06865 [Cladophialophora carrionii]|uniref:DUF6590 domain-containing protein n=1 Tax=Cladophialophora carrionii TaxID=86049 RepID=A0A1C1CLX0_9EURO|nr:hypothetical protein CLCR_06865 [Cladophialophora carrionii]
MHATNHQFPQQFPNVAAHNCWSGASHPPPTARVCPQVQPLHLPKPVLELAACLQNHAAPPYILIRPRRSSTGPSSPWVHESSTLDAGSPTEAMGGFVQGMCVEHAWPPTFRQQPQQLNLPKQTRRQSPAVCLRLYLPRPAHGVQRDDQSYFKLESDPVRHHGGVMGGRVAANPSPEDNQGDYTGYSDMHGYGAWLLTIAYFPEQCEKSSVSSPSVSNPLSGKDTLLIDRSPPSNYVPVPGTVRVPARQPVQNPPVPSAGRGRDTYGSAQNPMQQTTSRVPSSAVPRGNDPAATGRPTTTTSAHNTGQTSRGGAVESLVPGIAGMDLQTTQRPDQDNVPGTHHQQAQSTISRAPANGQSETTPRRYSVPAEATFFQDQTKLDERYFVRPSSFYTIGRVFAVLWHEGYNSMTSQNTYVSDNKVQVSTGRYGEPIYSSIRRMVVVREDRGYCVCLQINTYGNRGLSKFGNSSEDVEAHSRIYMVGTEPRWLDQEILTSSKLDIAVKKASPEQRLSVASRLCYGRVHTVEHTVKSMNVGLVTDVTLPYLLGYFRARQNRNVR